MRSALYEGVVRHRRHVAPLHTVSFRGLWLYLDLEEGDAAFRGRRLWGVDRRALFSVRLGDHLEAGSRPLDAVVRERVAAHTGRRPEGRIGLLTMPRFAGLGFNPVSFVYCWTPAEDGLEAVLAEVTNTPWHERHVYVLAGAGAGTRAGGKVATLPKRFHVSPFQPMDLEYGFRIRPPAARLAIAIENRRAGRRIFDAQLTLRRREIGGRALLRALVRHPLQPARVLAAIHLHALRLLLKGASFHPHPTSTPRAPASVPR